MKAKGLKGKKFHYEGEDANGSVFLSECTDDDKRVVVRLDKAKSGVPIKMGSELCQVRPDDSGHFEIRESVFSDRVAVEDASAGPSMVSTDEYRTGWERTFGSKAN